MNHEIRAQYTDTTIRVYQAYCSEIAKPALAAGRFVPPFSMSRMTWIKPSFNWMMYRSGFASKPNQEYVLGINILRTGFDWMVQNGVISIFDPAIHETEDNWRHLFQNSSIRIQWDPERTWDLQKLPETRSIQIGISGPAVHQYVNEWIVGIEDLTPIAHSIAKHIGHGEPRFERPDQLERPYSAP